MAATNIIGEDNTADQKTSLLEGVDLLMHTLLYFAYAYNTELLMSHRQVCTGVFGCTVGFGVPGRGAYFGGTKRLRGQRNPSVGASVYTP
jgi:hypothetical protein